MSNQGTKDLQTVVKGIDGIPSHIDMTSVRAGAIQEVASHRTTTFFDTAVRSGHQQELSVSCRSFEYTHCTPQATMKGGLGLAGYIDTTLKKAATARIIGFSGMSTEKQISMTNLMAKLFQSDIDFGAAQTNLYHCMFATFLMHLETFVSTYTANHLIVKEVVSQSRLFGFKYNDLVALGAEVREDFLLRNLAHQRLAPSVSQVPYTACIYYIPDVAMMPLR